MKTAPGERARDMEGVVETESKTGLHSWTAFYAWPYLAQDGPVWSFGLRAATYIIS